MNHRLGSRTIRVGSRESRLAVLQTRLVMDAIQKKHPQLRLELVTMKTTGDRILDRPLDRIGGKGLFVKELDRALLEGSIDLSVHSLKDMPMEVPEELPILSYFHRGDPRDCMVLPLGCGRLSGCLTQPSPQLFGCGSLRRRLQLGQLFPGCQVQGIRGNVLTRLARLDQGEYDALVLARAGLVRLGLEGRICRVFSVEEMLPAAGQGTLAVQGRRGEDYSFLEGLEDPGTRLSALAERQFVQVLDGGCSSPTAAYAHCEGGQLHLRGLYVHPHTGECRIGAVAGDQGQAQLLGEQLARRLR